MAKRSVKLNEALEEEITQAEEMAPELDEKELAMIEDEQREEHEKSLAPYRAVHAQQNDQDDLLAELLFEVDLLKLGLDK